MHRTEPSGCRTAGRWPGRSTAAPAGCRACSIPDTGSSRLAPGWLLHDSALPAAIRLLAVDRPGIGVSDPIGFGGTEQPAEDLRRMVETLAVGRVAVIGIGQGADDAFAFAARYPSLVTSVSAVSVRLPAPGANAGALFRHPFGRRHAKSWAGPLSSWISAAGKDADLTAEADLVAVAGSAGPGVRAGAGGPLAGVGLPGCGRRRRGPDQTRVDRSRPGRRAAAVGPRPERAGAGHLWHGKHEAGTTLQAVQAFAQALPRWTVRPANGSSAILGAWTGILGSAAGSFPGDAAAA